MRNGFESSGDLGLERSKACYRGLAICNSNVMRAVCLCVLVLEKIDFKRVRAVSAVIRRWSAASARLLPEHNNVARLASAGVSASRWRQSSAISDLGKSGSLASTIAPGEAESPAC